MNRAGEAAERLALVLAQQAGEQVRFAVAQAQPRAHLARAERRIVRAGDVHVGAARAALDVQVDQDVAVERHARRDVDVDADRLQLERVQRVDADAARRDRRVAGRDDRNLVAEVQRQLAAFGAAQLRLGDELGLGVALEKP